MDDAKKMIQRLFTWYPIKDENVISHDTTRHGLTIQPKNTWTMTSQWDLLTNREQVPSISMHQSRLVENLHSNVTCHKEQGYKYG